MERRGLDALFDTSQGSTVSLYKLHSYADSGYLRIPRIRADVISPTTQGRYRERCLLSTALGITAAWKHREQRNSASTIRTTKAAYRREFTSRLLLLVVLGMDSCIGNYRGTHTNNFLIRRAFTSFAPNWLNVIGRLI